MPARRPSTAASSAGAAASTASQPLPTPPIPLDPDPINPPPRPVLRTPEPVVRASAPQGVSASAHLSDRQPAAPMHPGSEPAATAPLATPPVPMAVDGGRQAPMARPSNAPAINGNADGHAVNGHAANAHLAQAPRPPMRPGSDPNAGPNGAERHEDERGATGPQLRRFIKSRAYVPMHELRRRFLINGGDDEVTPVELGERRIIFVGLPEREGRLLGELLRGGDIGYELSLDPISPIVVGVYPMRPVTRA